jgi:hypothetical protein
VRGPAAGGHMAGHDQGGIQMISWWWLLVVALWPAYAFVGLVTWNALTESPKTWGPW